MPIIVRNVLTQKRYILVGPAYGLAKANRGTLDPSYATFEEKLIVACDEEGQLHWLNSIEMVVETVGGRLCRDVLDGPAPLAF